MFSAHVLIIRRSKLHYTASGIITPVGGRPVRKLRQSSLSQPVHRTATYRCDDTRGCVMQFWPPDDEHMCTKHVEAWNKRILKQKFCASSWLITEINILRCAVSKMSKFRTLLHCGGKDCFQWHINGSCRKCLYDLCWDCVTQFFWQVLNSGKSCTFVGNLKRSSWNLYTN